LSVYYLDTSALLVRYIRRRKGHAWMSHVCDSGSLNTIGIAIVTETELAAALNQLVRGGSLRRKHCDEALALFWRHIADDNYTLLPVTAEIARRGADLCGVHALRGYDAVQLACALTYRDVTRAASADVSQGFEGQNDDPIFVTADTKLRNAAQAEGFSVDSPRDHSSAGERE
ncbi:MAG: type II toxin-antitoxin system VapC family toxin, partial [Ktedonobacterales bacterium]